MCRTKDDKAMAGRSCIITVSVGLVDDVTGGCVDVGVLSAFVVLVVVVAVKAQKFVCGGVGGESEWITHTERGG